MRFNSHRNSANVMASNSDTKSITLRTLYFYQGNLPAVLALHECGLNTDLKDLPLFCGIYGNSVLRDTLADIRHSPRGAIPASFTLIEYTIDNVRVPDKHIYYSSDDISQYDIVPTDRLKKEFREDLEKNIGTDFKTTNYSLNSGQQQAVIRSVYDKPEYDHIKLFKFTSLLTEGKKHIRTYGMPMKHWGNISSATCTFDPEVKITLEPPLTKAHKSISEQSPEQTKRLYQNNKERVEPA